jgi:hypothetical protein
MCVSTPSATQKQTGTRRLQSAQSSFPRRPRLPGIHLNPSPQLDSSCPTLQRQFNTHSPAASAANAGAFLQTSLSEVTRRSRSRRAPAFLRRVTPDRVIAYDRTHRRYFARRHLFSRCDSKPSLTGPALNLCESFRRGYTLVCERALTCHSIESASSGRWDFLCRCRNRYRAHLSLESASCGRTEQADDSMSVARRFRRVDSSRIQLFCPGMWHVVARRLRRGRTALDERGSAPEDVWPNDVPGDAPGAQYRGHGHDRNDSWKRRSA